MARPVGIEVLFYAITHDPFEPFDENTPIVGSALPLLGNLTANLVSDRLAFGDSVWNIYSVDFDFDITDNPVQPLAAGDYWFEVAVGSDYFEEDGDDPEFNPRVLWDWVNPSPGNTAMVLRANPLDPDDPELDIIEPGPANSFVLLGEIEAVPELDAGSALLPMMSLLALLCLVADRRRRGVLVG